MKEIPKKYSKYHCPICHKPLIMTYWGRVSLTDPKSDELWRFCCDSILDTSFGKRHCYFNTPIIRLPQYYTGEIDWSKIKNLTDNIHPVIKDAIDKAIQKNRFVS